jgi:Leucine-rich repeat (LRR) protein
LSDIDRAVAFATVKEVNLSHNNLTNAAVLLANFPALERLDLSFNLIQSIADKKTRFNVKHLTHLNLVGNRMQSTNDLASLYRLIHLEHLNIRFNPLSSDIDYEFLLALNLPHLIDIDGQFVERDEVCIQCCFWS